MNRHPRELLPLARLRPIIMLIPSPRQRPQLPALATPKVSFHGQRATFPDHFGTRRLIIESDPTGAPLHLTSSTTHVPTSIITAHAFPLFQLSRRAALFTPCSPPHRSNRRLAPCHDSIPLRRPTPLAVHVPTALVRCVLVPRRRPAINFPSTRSVHGAQIWYFFQLSTIGLSSATWRLSLHSSQRSASRTSISTIGHHPLSASTWWMSNLYCSGSRAMSIARPPGPLAPDPLCRSQAPDAHQEQRATPPLRETYSLSIENRYKL
jgi:hypothetical protein